MNGRIRQLAEQAGIGYVNLSTGNGDNWQFAGRPEELERFAELIVRECAVFGMVTTDDHFDVEALYKHFGVEE